MSSLVKFFIKIIVSSATHALVSSISHVSAESKSNHESDSTSAGQHSNANRSPASENNSTTESSSSSSHAKDPSLEVMKKITVKEIESRVQNSVKTLISNQISSLGSGASNAARVANEAFVRHAGQTISNAAKAGVILSKVEESDWNGAFAETAKKVSIDFVTKQAAVIVTDLVGCSNPVYCANVVRTILADVFISTDTAPPSMDMYQPIPPPTLEDVTRSRLPDLINGLNPGYPVFQNPK